MTISDHKTTLSLVCGAALAAVAATSALWFSGSPTVTRQLADHWGRQALNMPAAAAKQLMRDIASTDAVATPALVEILAGRRPELIPEAGRYLHQQLDRWATLPGAMSGWRVARMATCLERRAATMKPAAVAIAHQLTGRILAWEFDPQAVDTPQVWAACYRVNQRWLAVSQHGMGQAGGFAEVGRPAGDNGTPVVADRRVRDVVPPPLPGGSLPIDPVEIPALPPSLLAAPRQPDPTAATPPKLLDEPDPPSELPAIGNAVPNLFPGGPDGPPLDSMPHVTSTSAAPVPRATSDGESARLGELSALELVKQLSAAEPAAEYRITLELVRRGFAPAELALAKRFSDADPAVRAGLVAALDQLPIQPGRWLLWFSRDSDTEVRRQAALRMATTQDPVLQQRLEEMANSETDRVLRVELRRWADARSGSIMR